MCESLLYSCFKRHCYLFHLLSLLHLGLFFFSFFFFFWHLIFFIISLLLYIFEKVHLSWLWDKLGYLSLPTWIAKNPLNKKQTTNRELRKRRRRHTTGPPGFSPQCWMQSHRSKNCALFCQQKLRWRGCPSCLSNQRQASEAVVRVPFVWWTLIQVLLPVCKDSRGGMNHVSRAKKRPMVDLLWFCAGLLLLQYHTINQDVITQEGSLWQFTCMFQKWVPTKLEKWPNCRVIISRLAMPECALKRSQPQQTIKKGYIEFYNSLTFFIIPWYFLHFWLILIGLNIRRKSRNSWNYLNDWERPTINLLNQSIWNITQ